MNTLSNTQTFGNILIANPTIQRRILKGFSDDYGNGFANTYQDNFNKAAKSPTYDVIVDKYGDVFVKNKLNGDRTKIKGCSSTFKNLCNALRTVIMLDESY